MYQKRYSLKFKSLVSKSVNGIAVLKFIGLFFVCSERGVWLSVFVNIALSQASERLIGYPEYRPLPQANPG